MEQELTRATVDPRYTWDVTRIYASDEAWEQAYAALREDGKAFAALAGTLSSGREAILTAISRYAKLEAAMSRVYCYAMMKQNEDTTVGKYQGMLAQAASLASELGADGAFLMPELLALPDGTLEALIDDPDFAEYDAMLRSALRMKPHTLTAREEQLLAMAGDVCGAPENAYDLLTDADMDLGMTRG